MNRKEKLISSLNIVINALENDTAHYNWIKQHSCNCGLVAQTVLNNSPHELAKRIEKEDIFNRELFKLKLDNDNNTWKNAVKMWCPIAGKPMKQIFIDLEEAGLSKEDIVHLEYMDNPAILNLSGISKTKKSTERVNAGTKRIPRTDFWGKVLGLSKYENVYEDRVIEETYNWWSEPKNLVKYLKAWVSILKENRESVNEVENLSNQELNERLLVAIAEEDYESAAMLRDEINKL